MPFVGIGLHVVIALFFAVHVVRTGREMYWLLILFMFPLFGSIVYLFAVYLPSTRFDQQVRKGANAAVRILDPEGGLRKAKEAFDLTPTAQNRMRLAEALLDAGQAAAAVEQYEACLQGPFADDPDILLGAARARLKNGQAAVATGIAEGLRRQNPHFRPEEVALLIAQGYAGEGRQDDARREFAAAIARYGAFELRVEYAIWALGVGDRATAAEQRQEIEQTMKHWPKHAHTLNRPLLKRLDAALAGQGG